MALFAFHLPVSPGFPAAATRCATWLGFDHWRTAWRWCCTSLLAGSDSWRVTVGLEHYLQELAAVTLTKVSDHGRSRIRTAAKLTTSSGNTFLVAVDRRCVPGQSARVFNPAARQLSYAPGCPRSGWTRKLLLLVRCFLWQPSPP